MVSDIHYPGGRIADTVQGYEGKGHIQEGSLSEVMFKQQLKDEQN